jgi:hypothetical protein
MKRASQNIPAGLILLSAVLLSSAPPAPAQNPASAPPAYLYKTSFVRAAPGKLLALIDLLKARMPVTDAARDERPLWWRHTQGDQWDLMLLLPMGSYPEYYSAERIAKRKAAADASPLPQAEFLDRLNACSSWKEDVFVMGPPLETVKTRFLAAAYYHIEIMISQPGKQAELYRERERENIYSAGIGRPETMIFVRDQGAAWDIYTLGCYRDLAHWAESSSATKEQRDAAARQAGFKSPDEIGPYMRTLIDMHRDTMGVAIK